MAAPERIAMCTNPYGEGMYVPLDPGEPARTVCFEVDCGCTPVEFIRADLRKDGDSSATEAS